MKTEKRLTMALSVLVALMMLAVPLASSSNLFVDGGQTNSNGDAPVVGASTGYTITFQLNADGKSLDQVSETDLNTLITNLNTGGNNGGAVVAGATWYLNEDGDLCALVMYEEGITEVKLSTLIQALYDNTDSKISKGAAYKLISWKDATTGSTYDSTITNDDIIKKDMTFASQWELQSGYVEVPVTVDFDGDVKEYVKAYAYADGKITIGNGAGQLDDSALKTAVQDVGKLSIEGYVVNNTYGAAPNETHITNVYSEGKVTYGDNKVLPADDKTIPSTSKLTVTYTFNDSKFSKIVVSSIAFKDGKDVTLYADTASDYTYREVFDALIANGDLKVINDGTSAGSYKDGVITNEDNTVLTSDKHHVLSKWNGTEYLNSTRTAPATLTLDAKLNGYSIAFMSKGQYEVKFVEFGKLTADVCTLDVSGLDHWVMIKNAEIGALVNGAVANTFIQFNFASESNIKTIETEATTGTYEVDQPVYVLIACFTPSDKTAYAVFDANNADKSIEGNFGNEYINRIVLPGEISKADAESLVTSPSATPVYDEGNIFIGWGDNNKYSTVKDTVTLVNANVSSYKYTITLYDGSNVLGMFYMKTGANLTNEVAFKGDIVAIQYNGQLYGAPTGDHVEGKYQSIDAYNDLVFSKKNGYEIKEWNDADKNAMITFKLNDDKITIIDKVNIKDLKDNLSLYGQFEAKKYLIAYNGNTATATNNMPQEGTVDSAVNLFSDAAFSNDGYKLKEWNTRPDGKGTSYALGVSFTLTGEQYEDLKGVPTGNGLPSGYEKGFTLYAIWEKSGSTPGDNEGNDGNNTDTYLLAGILAVIIILIILIAFLMRRKN